ncbi:hypothetical protein [Novosphingobium sp. UBA1939]|uniref:hypothetical protein n=1 Tax=Novosphingobium sp. UBA1939 TaxID=1946982 RepID=UPI0025CD02C7|nr:hypothetical protein [Novosphingobium sp. UBA1939]
MNGMYLAYRCPHCGSEECGNDANAGWDVVTQGSVLLSEFDHQWCNACGDVRLEEFTITDPVRIAVIDQQRARLVVEGAAHDLLAAARDALAALCDQSTARRKGYDVLAYDRLLAAIALAEGRSAS